MDEAFEDYETGLVALRKRVVGDLKRKLSDSKALDRCMDIHESMLVWSAILRSWSRAGSAIIRRLTEFAVHAAGLGPMLSTPEGAPCARRLGRNIPCPGLRGAHRRARGRCLWWD